MKAIGSQAVRIGLATILFAVSSLAAGDAGFELVSVAEFQQEKDARSLITRGPGTQTSEPESQRPPDGPVIEVLTPDARQPVKAPVDISVRFAPGPDAKIVLDSLRIRYGMIGLDVTDRIRRAATVTEQGIQAPGAVLPVGSHSMSIEIADSAGRKAKQAFRFRVEE